MPHKGFTLLELLVVVAIIGILAAIVIVALGSGRTGAKDAAIKAHVSEFRKLMELEFIASGSYTNLNKGWVGTVACASRGYAGTYAAQAVQICEGIRANITNSSTFEFYTGVNVSAGFNNATQYSIMARLSTGLYYCMGSSGRNTDQGTSSGGWVGTGCWGNP